MRHAFAVAAIVLLLQPVALAAQTKHVMPPGVDTLVSQAMLRAAQGDTTAALKLLEQANDLAPDDPEVLYQRGYLLARSTFLRVGDVPRNFLAWRLLEHAADVDPNNARYLLEIGRIRLYTPLLRIEAERIFRKALRVAEDSGDPSQLADVCWELGQIKQRRYQNTKDRYLITSPGLLFEPYQASQEKHYTRSFLEAHTRPIDDIGSVDRIEAEELYRRGLRARPTHDANALGLLSVLYDQRRYREMRDVVRPFIAAGSGSAHLRFAAGLAAYRDGHLRDADTLFESALKRLTTVERDEVLSLNRIIRKSDSASYAALSPENRMHTDSAYWEAADPLLATPENEARLEYLARIAYADLRFSSEDMRQVGWRTDRGVIVARYGEPPVVASFGASNAPDASDNGRILTVWFYPSKERTFVFTGAPAMNYATFAADMRGVAEEQREDAPFLLDNLPVAANVDTMPSQMARFRGAHGDDSELVIAAAVNTPNLYRAAELDQSVLALSLRIGQPSRMKLVNSDTVPVRLPASRATKHTWSRQLPVGHYRVRVEALDVAVASAAARTQAEIDIVRPAIGVFAISDMMLTEKFTPPAGPLAGFLQTGMVPHAELRFAQREQFSVYWENYALRPDSTGRVHIDIQLRVTLVERDRSGQQVLSRMLGSVADLVGLTKERDEQLAVRFQREEALGARDRVPMMTTIGLGTAPAGEYLLQLIVTDRASGNVARTERTFHVSKE